MFIKDIVNSSIATGIAEIITLPICTLKTNYQNGQLKSTRIIPMTKELYNIGGIKAFYRASFPAIFGQIFSTTTKYTLYKYFQAKYDNKLISGATSGIISSFFTHPIDVIRIHWQMNEKIPVGVFYRGYSKTILKVTIASSLFFPLNDLIKENAYCNSFISGALSATLSTTIMHPFDYLKTRHVAGLDLYTGINIRMLYKGLSLNLLRIVPHFSLVIGISDYLKYKY